MCLSLLMILSFPFSKNCCFIHRCGKEWKGNRCHISTKPLQPPTSSLFQNGGSVKRKKYVSMNSLRVSFYLLLSLIVLILQIFGLGWPAVSCWLKLQQLPCTFFWRRKCQKSKWNFCVKQTQMWPKAKANCPVSLVWTFESPHSLFPFICNTKHKS